MKSFNLQSFRVVNPPRYMKILLAQKLAEETESRLPNYNTIVKFCDDETLEECINEMEAGNQIELS